jgi:hypothetical protein
MHKISARQPFVPGLLDLSEDEPSANTTGIDAWTIFAALIVAVGVGLLVWGTTGG